MRYVCTALFVLTLSAAASAQGVVTPFTPTPLQTLNALRVLQPPSAEARLSVDAVLARMMTFDRDRDGKVATGELSERMHGLVARGDKSGDGALDESEVRMLATEHQFTARLPQGGGYGFADSVGLSSRNHIENSIDDLRLAPGVRQEAKRIAIAFVDEFESAAVTNLREALAPVLTAQQLAQLEASLSRFHGVTVVMPSGAIETRSSAPTAAAVTTLLLRQRLQADPMKAVAVAADTFRAERQLDDARRSELVSRLSGLLTEEEGDNLLAALARRPLEKSPGSSLARALPLREVHVAAPSAVR